ncbi:acyl carrier protein [Pseudopontixanthobacter vadosimaris]|uniref:acyl carrier protein n=1 Tax=Pseudopontixanthobacter vadosimaris TaxID=2726450 RepID=UPI003B8352C4
MTEEAADQVGESAAMAPDRHTLDIQLRSILADILNLDADRVAGFTNATGLFGHLPELDSMAVAGLLTEMEDRLDILIEDDDVDGEMLETYGGLLVFAEAKVIGN